ncbi:MAG: tRNA (adenosine(37)-N6)-threonylcarbamoyltransferase complex dimerization subunit type 1 TsaB [Acholeplasmatales bacterium]|jgi:tRNA threonylcarbamoyl adenosine modification protein YeaZ|nr:tRNA (adenosine(37)-N6)-threonylcarbamoyltransferase complex dimerization subunit type 1 TsaB [Acholeplasmatales bacterium]
MKTLICDTSTETMFLVLVDNKSIYSSKEYIKLEHGKFLINKIDNLLSSKGISISEIDRFIIGIGPGSYTGLRISLMAFKMFVFSLNKPIYRISSLILLTSGYTNCIAANINARRNCCFAIIRNKDKILYNETYCTYDELEDLSKEHKAKIITINNENIRFDINIVEKNLFLIEDISHVTPNYMRKTEAEEKNESNKKLF